MAMCRSGVLSSVSCILRGKLIPLASVCCSYQTLSLNTQHVSFKQRTFLQVNPTHFVSFRNFSDLPPHVVLKLPSLSPTMETGTVVSWAKNEGDQVSEGDLLAEIETDKATMSMDASDEGYIAKILHPAGTKNIPVGDPLVIIVESEDLVSKFADYKPEAGAAPAAAAPKPVVAAPKPAVAAPKPAAAAPQPAAPAPKPAAAAPAIPVTVKPPASLTPNAGVRVFISPLARRVALERGIDINSLSGSGTGVDGSFVLADLDNIVSTPLPSSAGYTDLPITGMRATIAKRLTESKQTIPHYYLTVDINIDELMKLRKDLNTSIAKQDPQAKISVNDIFIKAMAHANKSFPDCNSSWFGDYIRQYNAVDVSVAVATPSGLITPIVFGADSKGLLTISQEVRALAQRAKENKLKPAEFQGGTITISNLGMYGVTSFSAIINPPQACILSVGGAQKRIVPDETKGHKEATYVSVTLCCDHRLVDGAVGAQWLSELKSLLECPTRMLL